MFLTIVWLSIRFPLSDKRSLIHLFVSFYWKYLSYGISTSGMPCLFVVSENNIFSCLVSKLTASIVSGFSSAGYLKQFIFSQTTGPPAFILLFCLFLHILCLKPRGTLYILFGPEPVLFSYCPQFLWVSGFFRSARTCLINIRLNTTMDYKLSITLNLVLIARQISGTVESTFWCVEIYAVSMRICNLASPIVASWRWSGIDKGSPAWISLIIAWSSMIGWWHHDR